MQTRNVTWLLWTCTINIVVSNAFQETEKVHDPKKYMIQVQDHQQAIDPVISTKSDSNPTEVNKRYFIEVQDRQQAVKLANPIVDLEDSVRRGINDPLADPRFVMNKINDDFFGSTISEPPSHPSELMNYRNRDRLSSSIIGVNTHAMNPLTPSIPSQQHAVKDQLVAKHPPSVVTVQDIGLPRQPISQIPDIGMPSRMPSQVSDVALPRQPSQLASLPSFSLPGFSRPSSYGSHGFSRASSYGRLRPSPPKINHNILNLKRGQNNRKMIEQAHLIELRKQLLAAQKRILQQKQTNDNQLNAKNQRIRQKPRQPQRQQQNNQPQNNQPQKQLGINALTGLPEDLEEQSFGGISSITAMTDPSPQPTSVTVSTSEDGTTTDPSPKSEQKSTEPSHDASSNEDGSNSNGNGGDENISSLKDYLEADNILRDKFGKDGLESDDSSQKPIDIGENGSNASSNEGDKFSDFSSDKAINIGGDGNMMNGGNGKTDVTGSKRTLYNNKMNTRKIN